MDEQLHAALALQSDGMAGREQCLHRAVEWRIDHAFIQDDGHPLAHHLFGKCRVIDLSERDDLSAERAGDLSGVVEAGFRLRCHFLDLRLRRLAAVLWIGGEPGDERSDDDRDRRDNQSIGEIRSAGFRDELRQREQ